MLISLIKYNIPKSHQIFHEIISFVYKIGVTVKLWYFGFSSWLLTLVMFTSSNSFSDNLTSSFTIHEMNDYQCVILKEINVIVSLIICLIVNNFINKSTKRKRNKNHGKQIQKLFYWKNRFHLLKTWG